MTTPITQVYQYVVGFSIILVAIPFRWHLRARNTGTCIYMIWIAIGCVNQFINSIMWAEDAIIRSPIWCDYTTHYQIALNAAIPACSLVISRRLFYIAKGRSTPDTKEGKRKEVIVDLLISVGIPLVSAGLSMISQGHRFDIYQELGCQPAVYATVAALIVVNIWPLFIACVSAAYTCCTVHALVKRNYKIRELIGSDPTLTFSRYWRFMILSSMDITFTIPLYAFSLYLTTLNLQPWVSWDNVHEDFGRIDQYTSLSWRADPVSFAILELNRWAFVLPAFAAFALFGFGAEAMKDYRCAWSLILSRFALLALCMRRRSPRTPGVTHARRDASQRGVLPISIPLDQSHNSAISKPHYLNVTSSRQELQSHPKTLCLGESESPTDRFKVAPIIVDI